MSRDVSTYVVSLTPFREDGSLDEPGLRAHLRRLAASGRVAAASMSAWNPDLDQDGQTGKICLHAFDLLIGEHAPTGG